MELLELLEDARFMLGTAIVDKTCFGLRNVKCVLQMCSYIGYLYTFGVATSPASMTLIF